MEFSILGPLEVIREGRDIDLATPKVRAVLAMLVIHAGEVVSADALVEALWGEDPPEGAVATLRTYVSQLRKLLGPEVIETRSPGYRLAVHPDRIDARRFEALVADGRHAEALELWRGPALVEFARMPLAAAEAARLEELRLVATEQQMEAELARGRHHQLVGRLRTLVEAHPLRERLWGQLVLALYRSGRGAEALRAAAELRRRLGEELGLEPGPVMRRLEADVAAQDPALEWRPAAPAAPTPTNLPTARSSFVGREEEIDELAKLLAAPGLVTLVGPGGVGKTRLATEVARRLLRQFPDGVWLVELAPLSDASLVPQAVATAVGVAEEPGRPLTQTLARAMGPKAALIVVDNCEHVIAAAAALADVLVAAAPNLGILATSRESLRVEGEVVWSTPTLPVPARDDLAPEAALDYDAVRLFCERAAVQGPFALDADSAPAVSALCRRLDGIPLAVELAAARSAALSPAQILERLDRRFRLLSTGRRAVPRHQTLQAAIEWSHDLLSHPERTLFRRLSVFRGFPLEAAERVCSGDDLAAHHVAPTLADLVDRSLVVAQPQGDGTLRYSLLDTLRTYAAERLAESGEEENVRGRHLEWIAELTNTLHAHVGKPGHQIWRNRVGVEHDNVRQAMPFAISTVPEEALRIVGNSGLLWATLGYATEGRAWAAQALAAGSGSAPHIRALALQRAGAMAQIQGDAATGRRVLTEALAALREVGDKRTVAETLSGFLASSATHEGDLDLAEEQYQEALAISRDIGDERGIAWCLGGLGLIAWRRRNLIRARTLLEDSVARFRAIGLRREFAQWQGNLAGVLDPLGETERAVELLEESAGIQRELGDRRVLPYSLASLGEWALQREDLTKAAAYFEDTLLIGREIGMPRHVGRGLRGVGFVALRRGDTALAATRLFEALTVLHDGGDEPEEAPGYVEAVAALAAVMGRPETSALLFGAADAVRAAVKHSLTPAGATDREREVAIARAALEEESFQVAWSKGLAMSTDEAIARAFDEVAALTSQQ